MKKLTALLALATALCMILTALPFALPAYAADTEKYPLWVGGVQVTAQNRYNIPGVKSGAAVYDPETCTLTLEDVTGMRGAYLMGSYMVGVYAKGLDLTVEGVQVQTGTWAVDNLINSTEYGFYSDNGSLTLKGVLKFSGPKGAIYVDGSLTLAEDARVTAETTGTSDDAVRMHKGGTFAGELTATGGYSGFCAEGPVTVTGGRITATGEKYGFRNENYYMNHPNYQQTGGEVYAEATAADGVGFFGQGPVSVTGGELHGKGKGGGVKSDRSITLGENMRIVLPENGKLSADGKKITDAADNTATEALLREYTEYPLSVGGVTVTSLNRDDLGEVLAGLNDDNLAAFNGGKLAASFDGDHTLTLSGEIKSSKTLIHSELPGLVIRAEGETKLTFPSSTGAFAILYADTVVTGGPLTVDGGDCAFYMVKEKTLTLKELDVTLKNMMYGLGGPNIVDRYAALAIDQCAISAACSKAAVCDFWGGITVNNCSVKTPGDYQFSADGSTICLSDGTTAAKTLEIIHLYEFTRQPVGGVVEKGCYRMVYWETNFEPIATEWLSNGSVYMSGTGDYQSYSFDASANARRIRQYYAPGKYVTSDAFYVTQAAEGELVEYPLLVGGIQVTSENRQDLGRVLAGLNDGNRALYEAGQLTASFNGSYVLTLSGKIKTDAAAVENQGVGGFRIYADGDVSLLSTGAPAVVACTDTLIEGTGVLSAFSETDSGIFVNRDACLTVSGMRLSAQGKTCGIAGNGSKKSRERLVIADSYVEAKGVYAISRFNGGITLAGCAVAEPAGAVTGLSDIQNPDHSAAANVVIDRDKYRIWLGGVRVTRANLDDIPGVTGGRASYDPKTGVLHFENVTGAVGSYIYETYYPGVQLLCSEPALIITGKAAFAGSAENDGLIYARRLTVEAELTVNNETGAAVKVGNGLTVQNCTASFHSGSGAGISAVNSGVKIENAALTCVGGNSGISARDSVEIENSTVTARGVNGYGIYCGSMSNTCLSVKNSTVRVQAGGSKNVFVSDRGVIRLLAGADVEAAYTGDQSRVAMYSHDAMELDETLEIALPAGGTVNGSGTMILTEEGKIATHVHIKTKHVHTPEYVSEVPADYDHDGVKAHYRCTGCGELFEDGGCTVPTTAEALRIPKLTPPAVKLGDVDEDGEITAADARLALRKAVDLETYAPGSREFLACDVDKDGEVTAADARKILRAAVELEDPSTW